MKRTILAVLAAVAIVLGMTTMPATGVPLLTVASFNVKGADDATFKARLPDIVRTMRAVPADVYLIQEARVAKNQPDLLLAELKKQTAGTSMSNWYIVKGPHAQHIIFNGRFTLDKKTVLDIGDGRWYVSARLEQRSSGQTFWVWTTHLIAASDTLTTEEASVLRKEEAEKVGAQIAPLNRVIGGGDINSHHTHEDSVAARFGHDDVRTRVETVENGQYDSNDDFLPNAMNGEWIDRLFAGPSCTVHAVGLVDSGDASDHNMIWARVTMETVT